MERFSYPEDGPPADLTIEAHGYTLAEAFANAGLAAFNAMTPLEGVEERESRTIELSSEDPEGLLYDFLAELLYLHDAELLVFSRIEIQLDEKSFKLEARCHGERFDPERHRSGMVVKAVTFHQMRIDKVEGGWTIRVVFDT